MLTNQVREKRLREENDARANKSYMNRWVERTDEENKKLSLQEKARKDKMLANQQFLRDQMTTGSVNTSVAVAGSETIHRKK